MSLPRTPLLLSASRSSWAVSAQHGTEWEKHKVLTPALRQKIFDRDNHTCQACGWRADRFQEIHHRDGDHSNHAEDNLETLCPLCHQTFHLPIAAATHGGVIVWLPDISQEKLNLLCIGLFVAQRNPEGKMAGTAKSLYSALDSKKAFVNEYLGKSDPGMLAQVLLNLKPEDYARRADFVGPLRLLPAASRFETQIDYWVATVFKKLPESQWAGLIEGLDVAGLSDDA